MKVNTENGWQAGDWVQDPGGNSGPVIATERMGDVLVFREERGGQLCRVAKNRAYWIPSPAQIAAHCARILAERPRPAEPVPGDFAPIYPGVHQMGNGQRRRHVLSTGDI